MSPVDPDVGWVRLDAVVGGWGRAAGIGGVCVALTLRMGGCGGASRTGSEARGQRAAAGRDADCQLVAGVSRVKLRDSGLGCREARVILESAPTGRRPHPVAAKGGSWTCWAVVEERPDRRSHRRQLGGRLERLLADRTFVATSVREQGGGAPIPRATSLRVSFGWFAIAMHPQVPLIGWEANCNSYTARVRISPTRLRLGGLGLTLVGCSMTPAGREDRWLEAFFKGDPRWRLRGRVLTLSTGRASIRLVESAVDRPVEPPAGAPAKS